MRFIRSIIKHFPGVNRVVRERDRFRAERTRALTDLQVARDRVDRLEWLLCEEAKVRRRQNRALAAERGRRRELAGLVERLKGQLVEERAGTAAYPPEVPELTQISPGPLQSGPPSPAPPDRPASRPPKLERSA